MKKNSFYLLFITLFVLASNSGNAQSFTGRIGVTGTTINTVNCYLKASTGARKFFTSLTFSVSIPDNISPIPTVSIAPSAVMPGYVWTTINTNVLHRNNRYYWGFSSSNADTANSIAFTTTEFSAAVITFNNSLTSNTSVIQMSDSRVSTQSTPTDSLVDQQFYVEVGGIGEASADPTLGGVLFYNVTGNPGSASGTTAGGDQYSVSNSTIVLPVTLVSFTAVKSGTANNLSWIVSSEVNAKGYDIERSSGNGVNFTAIGHVAANNNGKYSFTDESPLGGVNYYRLKMVDIDGQFKYSEVRSVLFDGTTVLFDIYPNPVVTNTLYLHLQQYTYEGKAQAIITDIAGRSIQSTNIVVVKGNNQVPLTVKKLTKGTYFVTVYDANGAVITETKKLVK